MLIGIAYRIASSTIEIDGQEADQSAKFGVVTWRKERGDRGTKDYD